MGDESDGNEEEIRNPARMLQRFPWEHVGDGVPAGLLVPEAVKAGRATLMKYVTEVGARNLDDYVRAFEKKMSALAALDSTICVDFAYLQHLVENGAEKIVLDKVMSTLPSEDVPLKLDSMARLDAFKSEEFFAQVSVGLQPKVNHVIEMLRDMQRGHAPKTMVSSDGFSKEIATRYAGTIVFQYCGLRVKNNIVNICCGGGGLWPVDVCKLGLHSVSVTDASVRVRNPSLILRKVAPCHGNLANTTNLSESD